MARTFFAALLLVVAGGCRMCSDSCDYSPPVADGPYAGLAGRAGSAFNGVAMPTTPPTPQAPPEGTAPVTPPAVAPPEAPL